MVDQWEQRYRSGDYPHGQAADPVVELAADLLEPGEVLDLACGAGRHALYLASRGWRVTAVDGSVAALALFDAPGITKIEADLDRWSAAGREWDLMIDTLFLDRRWLRDVPARAIACVLPLADDDPAVKPMSEAWLTGEGELERLFADWEIVHAAIRKRPGARRLQELVAIRRRAASGP